MLSVAQAIMGIPSDRRFLAVARKRLVHLFPDPPKQPGYFKRRRRLTDTLGWLLGVFASQSPGAQDDLLVVASTPVPCAQSRETVCRSAMGDAADYGLYCSHSRYFWGRRPGALRLGSPPSSADAERAAMSQPSPPLPGQTALATGSAAGGWHSRGGPRADLAPASTR